MGEAQTLGDDDVGSQLGGGGGLLSRVNNDEDDGAATAGVVVTSDEVDPAVHVVAEGEEDRFDLEFKCADEQVLMSGLEIPREEANTDWHLLSRRRLDDILESVDLLLESLDGAVT
jgi:hypothetical protein